MYLQASKDLDDPTHTCSLINASAFPTVFTLYIILVSDVFFCICLCFLVLNQTDRYVGNKRRKKCLFSCLGKAPINK